MAEERGRDLIGAMLAGAKSLPAGWWLLVVAITAGTNALDFFAAQDPDARRSAFFAVAAAIRVLLVFGLAYALLRRLADARPALRFGMTMLRTFLFMVGTVALLAGSAALAALITGGDARSMEVAVAVPIITTLVTVALVRLYAWQAALAVGDRELGPAGAWRALAGAHGRLAAAYLIVAAIGVVHSLLTRLAIVPGRTAESLLALAAVDGIVSALQLVLGCALAVAAWRAARTRAEPLREAAAVA